ncbi:MAG: sulfite exporter TauE/SafE family protein [Verrucomicrobiales bacterium]
MSIVYGLIVGLALGLTGGGGSIFAVPLLVFGLELDFRRAVAVSLAVVGLTALFGAILQARSRQVLWGAGALLGAGGILAAPLGARLGEMLPDQWSLLLFAILMSFIGVRMLLPNNTAQDVPISWMSCERKEDGTPKFTTRCAAKIFTSGMLAGLLSGIFGVGGGFLIVPVLLMVTKISMPRALATSLVGIFLISSSSFAANAVHMQASDWPLAGLFLLGAAAGMLSGVVLKKWLPGKFLPPIFGVSSLGVALWILVTQIVQHYK